MTHTDLPVVEAPLQPEAGGEAAARPLSLADSLSPERFINRELSWLAFNTRVLQ